MQQLCAANKSSFVQVFTKQDYTPLQQKKQQQILKFIKEIQAFDKKRLNQKTEFFSIRSVINFAHSIGTMEVKKEQYLRLGGANEPTSYLVGNFTSFQKQVKEQRFLNYEYDFHQMLNSVVEKWYLFDFNTEWLITTIPQFLVEEVNAFNPHFTQLCEFWDHYLLKFETKNQPKLNQLKVIDFENPLINEYLGNKINFQKLVNDDLIIYDLTIFYKVQINKIKDIMPQKDQMAIEIYMQDLSNAGFIPEDYVVSLAPMTSTKISDWKTTYFKGENKTPLEIFNFLKESFAKIVQLSVHRYRQFYLTEHCLKHPEKFNLSKGENVEYSFNICPKDLKVKQSLKNFILQNFLKIKELGKDQLNWQKEYILSHKLKCERHHRKSYFGIHPMLKENGLDEALLEMPMPSRKNGVEAFIKAYYNDEQSVQPKNHIHVIENIRASAIRKLYKLKTTYGYHNFVHKLKEVREPSDQYHRETDENFAKRWGAVETELSFKVKIKHTYPNQRQLDKIGRKIENFDYIFRDSRAQNLEEQLRLKEKHFKTCKKRIIKKINSEVILEESINTKATNYDYLMNIISYISDGSLKNKAFDYIQVRYFISQLDQILTELLINSSSEFEYQTFFCKKFKTWFNGKLCSRAPNHKDHSRINDFIDEFLKRQIAHNKFIANKTITCGLISLNQTINFVDTIQSSRILVNIFDNKMSEEDALLFRILIQSEGEEKYAFFRNVTWQTKINVILNAFFNLHNKQLVLISNSLNDEMRELFSYKKAKEEQESLLKIKTLKTLGKRPRYFIENIEIESVSEEQVRSQDPFEKNEFRFDS